MNPQDIVSMVSTGVVEFSDDEKRWLRSTINNPIFSKVISAMMMENLTEESGMYKKSLSPDEYKTLLMVNNIKRTLIAELKADMESYSTIEEPAAEEQEELDLSYVPGLKE